MGKTVKLTVKLDHKLIKDVLERSSKKGVFTALDHLAAVSKEQVPLDQGPLKNSCVVSVADDGQSGTVSYDTPYAVVQHEAMHFQHQRGRKPKYLEDPVNDGGVQNQMLELLKRAFGEEMR